MEITIDGNKLDYRLEGEKNLGEVIKSLENWLVGYRTMITAISVDGEDVDPTESRSYGDKKLTSVATVALSTAPVSHLETESLVEALDYLERYEQRLDEQSREVVSSSALEGLHWVITSVRLVAGLHGIDLRAYPDPANSLEADFIRLEQILREVASLDGEEEKYFALTARGEAILRRVFSACHDFGRLVGRSCAEELDVIKKLDRLRENFRTLVNEVDRIATDLQTGNEGRAMITIQGTAVLFEALFKAVRGVETAYDLKLEQLRLGERNLEEWILSLVSIGKEIITAFDNKDTVLLGDLFEYEIKEQINQVPEIIDCLKQEVAAKN